MSSGKGFRICLWFDGNAQEAVAHYTSIFKDSHISSTSHYREAGKELHGQTPGAVMAINFELNGQRFSTLRPGLNPGPTLANRTLVQWP